MKVLCNWLKEFVDLKASATEIRSRLSLSGTAVDSLEETSQGPVLDAEITINRPDCLGHLGIGRELSALYRLPLKSVHLNVRETLESAESVTSVVIEAPELCSRFTARVIRGVKVQPSPDWLRSRLEAIGQAAINNVVDVTNYVMFETGKAIHAYDFDRLAGRRIVVRNARQGEAIRTLDGAERKLARGMCVIADANHAVGIGGIMGGAQTEISSATRNVLIESAWFDPVSIRRTSKTLGLRTEASLRFERGADLEIVELAASRAAELIQQLGGGEVLAGAVDVYPKPRTETKIEITRKELLRVMGADVPDREIEGILGTLGFHPARVDSNRSGGDLLAAAWECTQPSWRADVTREIDLIEEVSRVYGYDKFPPSLPAAKLPAARLPHAGAQDGLRERLVALGYQEIVGVPLVDPERDSLFRLEGIQPAVISNPLAQDASVMRSSGMLNMLQTLEWNLNRAQRNLRLFEIGKRYEVKNGRPRETPILTIGATGLAREKSIHEEAREFTFADLKGDLDQLGAIAGRFSWMAGGPPWLAARRASEIAVLHPAKKCIGAAGQISSRIAELFKLRQDVYAAELELEPTLEAIESVRSARRYQPLPRFPGVERDFSLILPERTTFDQVAEAIRGLKIPELREIEARDFYRGKNVPEGTYSLLIHVSFQSSDATLTDSQLADFSSQIVTILERSVGAALRSR